MIDNTTQDLKPLSVASTMPMEYNLNERRGSQLNQQQLHQQQPPSALKSGVEREVTVKTVTFSDDLLQEHTFAPSNASSPFPPMTTSSDMVFDMSVPCSTAMNQAVNSMMPQVNKRVSLDLQPQTQQQIPLLAVTPAEEKKKPVRTNGLQDFEPQVVEGEEPLSLARLRWMAAFNKIVSQLDIGDPEMVSTFIISFNGFALTMSFSFSPFDDDVYRLFI